MKNVYILRAVPGAGKSKLADELVSGKESSIICCADDYFTDADGNYLWYPEGLYPAHKWCQELFAENLADGTETIVVANTNTREKDVNAYRKLAIEAGYTVFVLTVENWHNGMDVHNVPEEAKEKMREQIKNSQKL